MQPDNPKSNIFSIKCIGYVPTALLDAGASRLQFQYTFNVFCFVRHGYSLQLRLQIVGKEPVLNPAHQSVGLLGQTKGQDLNT